MIENGEKQQVRCAWPGKGSNIPRVTSSVVDHKANPVTSQFTGLRSSVKAEYRVIEWYGTELVSQVLVRLKMLQYLMFLWCLVLALISSSLFSSDWMLASNMLGRGGWCDLSCSLFWIPAHQPQYRFLWGHCSRPRGSYSATMCWVRRNALFYVQKCAKS